MKQQEIVTLLNKIQALTGDNNKVVFKEIGISKTTYYNNIETEDGLKMLWDKIMAVYGDRINRQIAYTKEDIEAAILRIEATAGVTLSAVAEVLANLTKRPASVVIGELQQAVTSNLAVA